MYSLKCMCVSACVCVWWGGGQVGTAPTTSDHRLMHVCVWGGGGGGSGGKGEKRIKLGQHQPPVTINWCMCGWWVAGGGGGGISRLEQNQ